MTGTVGRCCGRALPCYEIRIWRSDDREVEAAPGEIGEIGGRGASLMLGYFGNQEATEAAFNSQGFLMSGDLGRINGNGDIEIVGRAKDLVIRGGHNIYPVEIEDLAIRHPDVAKVAAFAVPDTRLGEKVCLAVIPVAERSIVAGEMLAHLAREGLSRYDMPEYFLILDEMPMTPSGKVLKRQLVDDAKDGRLRPEAVRWSGEGR
ncbi:class I adenylate-forming enzyme family protein [Methylobacterium frigidaeris]|uniref:Medium-chain fatty-acid--CoA ligase n=1 Tax=Methylobacterium frigidaeris TaxID=2038277 RepID=A0AA37HIY5_9HYPH|nr:class I adenylate-forming enzyme family protein [Methylobacterium frigidaeris]GJD66015.1 Medium-chain fatty-acid--CoA ligase [Methylobacterium frigidaeris]